MEPHTIHPGWNAFMSRGGRSGQGNSFAALQDAVAIAMEQQEAKAANVVAVAPRLRYPMVWIDLEMTDNVTIAGLDVESDTILQIACVITDGHLVHIVQGPELCIHHDEEVLASMNAWCIENHAKSGLTQLVRDSTVTMAEAEQPVLAFIHDHVAEPATAQLAGNSVHVDLAFLRKWMPRIPDFLSYRIVDVSSVAELARRWHPRQFGKGPRKKSAHTAMADILESIEQLRYYKQAIFKDPKTCS